MARKMDWVRTGKGGAAINVEVRDETARVSKTVMSVCESGDMNPSVAIQVHHEK